MKTLTAQQIETGNTSNAAYVALRESISANGASSAATTAALATLNAARATAAAAGHPAYMNTTEVILVDGHPFAPTTVTYDRATQVLDNAATANAR